MTIEQTNVVDFVTIDRASGELWLTISDHLPWEEDEGTHLILLQDKLNAYLRFIESGEVFEKVPDSRGRSVVINLIGKFPLSQKADYFLTKARSQIEHAGFHLRFTLKCPNSGSTRSLPH